jgi:hypothetical protein
VNKKLETLLERIEAWPDDAQAELVDSILAIESKHLGVYRLTDDERAAVRRGLEEMRAGKFASDEEVAAVFDRYR